MEEEIPIWFNILVYMTMYQWYLLAAILPTIYLVIVRIFGFPLLTRWSNEVVIMLHPNKAYFAKINSQYDPYFGFKKGVYWFSSPLLPLEMDQPQNQISVKDEKRLQKIEQGIIKHSQKPKMSRHDTVVIARLTKRKDKILNKKAKQNIPLVPPHQLHIYSHAINQTVYDMERRKTKLDEMLNNAHKVAFAKKHGIWIMRYPLLHFHRHWQIITDEKGQVYKLNKVNERQQFGVGFYHSLGVKVQKEVIEEQEVDHEGSAGSGGGGRPKLVEIAITNTTVIQSIKNTAEYQNYSASHALKILKHLKKLDSNFYYWISGAFNPLPIVILGGAVACVILVLVMFHGGSPSGLGPMPGGK